MPNVLSPRDLVSRPDIMDETVLSSDTKVVINHRVGNLILNSMLSYLSIKSLHKQVIQKLHV